MSLDDAAAPDGAPSASQPEELLVLRRGAWRQRLWTWSLLMLLLAGTASALWSSQVGPELSSLQRRHDAALAVEEDPDPFRALLSSDPFAADPEARLLAEVSSSASASSMALVELTLGDPVPESGAVSVSQVRMVLRGSASAASRMLGELLTMGPHLRISRVDMGYPDAGPAHLEVHGLFRRVSLAPSS